MFYSLGTHELSKMYEDNGGPLSVVRLLGLPYCEKSCVNFCMTVSAVFVVILNANGYLLNVSAMSRYSFPLKLKKSAARSYQGASGISLGNIGWMCWGCLVLSGCFASLDIFHYVHVYPRPI